MPFPIFSASAAPAAESNPFTADAAAAAPAQAPESSLAPGAAGTFFAGGPRWAGITDAYYKELCRAMDQATPRTWLGFLTDCLLPILIGFFILVSVLAILPKVEESSRGGLTLPILLSFLLIIYGSIRWWWGAPAKK